MEKAMKKISLLILFGSFLIIQSCNSKGKNDKKGTDTTTSPTTTTTTSTTDTTSGQMDVNFTGHNFPVLYIEFDRIVTAFTEPTLGIRKKIVFRFNFDGSAYQPTLTGFPAKNNGNYVGASAITLTASTVTYNLSTPFYLCNIEMSDEEYKQLRDSPLRARYLWLIPIKSPAQGLTNVINYYSQFSANIPASKAVIKPYDVGDELNPSPPRDPQ